MEGWSDCLLVLTVAWIDDQFYAEAIQELCRTHSFKPKMFPTVQEIPKAFNELCAKNCDQEQNISHSLSQKWSSKDSCLLRIAQVPG